MSHYDMLLYCNQFLTYFVQIKDEKTVQEEGIVIISNMQKRKERKRLRRGRCMMSAG